jgi:hypothetical protein
MLNLLPCNAALLTLSLSLFSPADTSLAVPLVRKGERKIIVLNIPVA